MIPLWLRRWLYIGKNVAILLCAIALLPIVLVDDRIRRAFKRNRHTPEIKPLTPIDGARMGGHDAPEHRKRRAF